MATDITTIRLPPKDSMVIDHFVDIGEFKSRSEFMRYAIKKTICDLVLKEFHEKIGRKGRPTKKEIEKLVAEIRGIRKGLWKEYAKHIP
jgi:Arc/MetJ-type ribon-helix-helix transcriptional regulator